MDAALLLWITVGLCGKQNINGGEPQKMRLDGHSHGAAPGRLRFLITPWHAWSRKEGASRLVAAQALFDETPQILAALDELGEKSQGDLAKGIRKFYAG